MDHRPARLSTVERALALFTEMRPGEGATSLWMLLSVFLILAAYYFVKPARDGLLAVSPAGGLSETELKAYSSFGQSLLLLLALPLYDRLAKRVERRRLITLVTWFFASNLVAFWALQPGFLISEIASLGIVFYLWVGVFNVFVIAQFWAFAADLYDDEAGQRQFPLIAIGATAGAAAGAWIAKQLVNGIGTYGLLLVAAAVLVSSLATVRRAEALGAEGDGRSAPELSAPPDSETRGGFTLVFRHEYLLATALMILVLNWVNSNGENFLFGAVERQVHASAAAQGLTGEAANTFVRDRTTGFYGDLFFWVNLVALLLQTLVASRVLRYGGFAAILFCLPVISLLSYTAMALLPTLAVIRVMKIAENAADYSLNNTAKQVLWLPTTADMKYRAKAVIDSLFVRAGDGAAALTAFVATNLFVFPTRALFALNAVIVVLWLALARVVAREHARRSAAVEPAHASP